MASRPYRVHWTGPLGRRSGLGSASREYVKALRRQGVAVDAAKIDAGELPACCRQGARVLVYHYAPNTLDLASAKRQYDRVVLNTVWETTRIPAAWRASINRFDAVIVPSKHNVQALRDSGVRVPVYLAPHGVDIRAYQPSNPPTPLLGSKGRFVFLSVFGFQHRKNPEALLRAYWEQFSDKDNVLLVIKTNGYGAGQDGAWIGRQIENYRKSLKLRIRRLRCS